jgi:hypothetical protein
MGLPFIHLGHVDLKLLFASGNVAGVKRDSLGWYHLSLIDIV